MATFDIDEKFFENNPYENYDGYSFELLGFSFKPEIFCNRLLLVFNTTNIPAYNLDLKKEEIINFEILTPVKLLVRSPLIILFIIDC